MLRFGGAFCNVQKHQKTGALAGFWLFIIFVFVLRRDIARNDLRLYWNDDGHDNLKNYASASKERNCYLEDADEGRVEVEVFCDATTNASEHLVVFGAIKLLVIHISSVKLLQLF